MSNKNIIYGLILSIVVFVFFWIASDLMSGGGQASAFRIFGGGLLTPGAGTERAGTNVVLSEVTDNTSFGTTTPTGKFQIAKEPVGDGTVATTTVSFGDTATTTSRSCFNAKSSSGTAISFYFDNSNSMIIDATPCP